MVLNKNRIYVTKVRTGAVWSTSSLTCGVWRKDDLGLKMDNTQQVGYVTTQFNPFNARNKKRFQLLVQS